MNRAAAPLQHAACIDALFYRLYLHFMNYIYFLYIRIYIDHILFYLSLFYLFYGEINIINDLGLKQCTTWPNLIEFLFPATIEE